MKKIRLTSVRNIPILDKNFDPQPNDEWAIVLVTSLLSTEKPAKQGEEDEDIIYKMKVLYPEMAKKVGTHYEVKLEQGYSPSQKLRFALKSMFKRAGLEDNEENYEEYMSKLIEWVNKKFQ